MKKKALSLLIFAPFILSAMSCGNSSDNSTANNSVVIPTISIDFSKEKSIVIDNIPEKIALYDYIPITKVYGLCDEVHFPISAHVTKPNGETIETSNNVYVDQEGEYQITFISKIGDETITKSTKVSASLYSHKARFEYLNSSFQEDDVDFSDKISRADSSSGIKLRINSANSTIKFKEVVNLKKVTGNLIEFNANAKEDFCYLKELKITFTDAYVPSKKVSVLYRANDTLNYPSMWTHGAMNAFVQIEYDGVIAAETKNYPPISTHTVLWDQSMWTDYSDDVSITGHYAPCSFRYDYEDKRFFAIGKLDDWDDLSKYYTLYDLDNPNDDYKDFAGWTTGEVYVSFEGNGSTGNFVVSKIGNNILNNADKDSFNGNAGELLTKDYDFDNMVDGAVNCYYPLPDASYSSNEVNKHLYLSDGINKTELDNVDFNNFVPTQIGHYIVSYDTTNYFGKKIQYEGEFDVLAEPYPFVDNSSVSLSTSIFDTNIVPTFSYSGGNGKITKRIELIVGDEIREVKEGEAFIISKKVSVNKLRVTVNDEIKHSKTYEYPIHVNYNKIVFKFVDSFENITVMKGNDFEVPSCIAIDYSKNNIDDTNIPVIIKQGKTKTYQAGDKITVENDAILSYCYGSTVLKELYINCVDYEINAENIGEQFGLRSGVGDIYCCATGTNFVSNGSSTFNFYQPYPVGISNLNISFTVFAKHTHYNTLKIEFISLSGNSVLLEFKELASGKPNVYINGFPTNIIIDTVSDIYRSDDKNELKGETYFTYSFVFDGARMGIFNAANVQTASFNAWSNGEPLVSFDKACTMIKFSADSALEGDIISLNKISNQSFTTAVLNFGDLASPTISFETPMSSSSFSKGDYFIVPKGYAYDCLSKTSVPMMSITDPDGGVIIENVPAQEFPIAFNKFGSYTVSYSFRDMHGNRSTIRYILVIRDNEPPVITLNEQYQDTYAGSVTIIGATVKDNSDPNPSLLITIKSGDNNRQVVEVGQKVELNKGKYEIIYYAFDRDGNSSRLSVPITIK